MHRASLPERNAQLRAASCGSSASGWCGPEPAGRAHVASGLAKSLRHERSAAGRPVPRCGRPRRCSSVQFGPVVYILEGPLLDAQLRHRFIHQLHIHLVDLFLDILMGSALEEYPRAGGERARVGAGLWHWCKRHFLTIDRHFWCDPPA
jgi:hypothetical protein